MLGARSISVAPHCQQNTAPRLCGAPQPGQLPALALSSSAQQPLDLGQLGIALLQHRRAPHEHVEAEVVAGRHLIRQAAEVPVQLGDLLGQLVAPAPQLAARPSSPERAA